MAGHGRTVGEAYRADLLRPFRAWEPLRGTISTQAVGLGFVSSPRWG